MTTFARFAEENRNLTINEAALVWSAITKERERIAKVIQEFDDFVYHDPKWATGSVVDERPSMERLAALVRSGK